MTDRNLALAHVLNGLLVAKGWTRSDLARQMFGTYTDPTTGYVVARGRDRISSWLNGKQYPTPENLRRLALAFGVTVEELAPPKGPIKGYFIAYW
jgi:transcriptional regulator with XRE-family HTH domain